MGNGKLFFFCIYPSHAILATNTISSNIFVNDVGTCVRYNSISLANSSNKWRGGRRVASARASYGLGTEAYNSGHAKDEYNNEHVKEKDNNDHVVGVGEYNTDSPKAERNNDDLKAEYAVTEYI